MTDMTRYQVIPPETSGRLWEKRERLGLEILRWWREILVSTKKEQMQLTADKFPEERFLPWGLPRELNDMPVALWLKRQPNVSRKQTKWRAFFRWRCNHAYAWHRGWDVRRPLHARVRGRLERKGRSLTKREHRCRASVDSVCDDLTEAAIIWRWKRVCVASSSLVGTTTDTRTDWSSERYF